MKFQGEINYETVDTMLEKLTDYSLTNDKYQILIYGQGGRPKSFYRKLKSETDIELLWTGWSGPKWTLIFSFIPGQSVLIRLKNKKRLKEFYNDIGAQSFCGLCFVDKDGENEIIRRITIKDEKEIYELIETSESNFMVNIDFDYHGGQKDGEIVYKIAYVGQKVDPIIVKLLSED
jgi:hypothetical protein